MDRQTDFKMGLNIDASGRRNSTNSKEEVPFYEPYFRSSHNLWLIDNDLTKASQGQEGQNNAVGGGDWKMILTNSPFVYFSIYK